MIFTFLHNKFILIQMYEYDTHRRGGKITLINKKISYEVLGASNLTSLAACLVRMFFRAVSRLSC
jgi:hypothetical protein